MNDKDYDYLTELVAVVFKLFFLIAESVVHTPYQYGKLDKIIEDFNKLKR